MTRCLRVLPFALLVVTLGSQAQTAVEPREQPALRALATAPSEAELHATIARLVGFGTRHTLSDTKSNTRGIGAARRWVKARFEQIARDCGGCLEVVTPAQTFTGKRVPQPTEVMDVVAIKRGSDDPQRVIVMTGHLDSRGRASWLSAHVAHGRPCGRVAAHGADRRVGPSQPGR